MVVPADMARGISAGTLKPLQDAAKIGIRSAIVNETGRIQGHAKFVPVSLNRAAVVASLGVTVGLVLVTAALEYQARKAEIERMKRIEQKLDAVRADQVGEMLNDMRAAWRSVRESAALLLDQSDQVASVGADSAAQAARKAFERAASDVRRWRSSLSNLPARCNVDLLDAKVPGLATAAGEFGTRLELCLSALELERARLLLVVEQVLRRSTEPTLEKVLGVLREHLTDVERVEAELLELAVQLGELELEMPPGRLDFWWSKGSADGALESQRRISQVGQRILTTLRPRDEGMLAIDVVQEADGNLILLDPAWTKPALNA